MISHFGKGERHVQSEAHRGGDYCSSQAGGGGADGGRSGAGGGGVQAHDLRLESEVRRDGGERGAGSEAITRRKRATQEAGGGSEFGQGRVAIGNPKKRMELAVMKAAVGQVREEYAFSQRRACGLLTMSVSSYRYQSRRSDEELRVRLVELAREKPRFGYRRLHVLLRRSGERGYSRECLWNRLDFHVLVNCVVRAAGICRHRTVRNDVEALRRGFDFVGVTVSPPFGHGHRAAGDEFVERSVRGVPDLIGAFGLGDGHQVILYADNVDGLHGRGGSG